MKHIMLVFIYVFLWIIQEKWQCLFIYDQKLACIKYQMIYRISIILYRYKYRIEKTDRYTALQYDQTFDLKINVCHCDLYF